MLDSAYYYTVLCSTIQKDSPVVALSNFPLISYVFLSWKNQKNFSETPTNMAISLALQLLICLLPKGEYW